MTADRWSEIERLLHQAMQLAPDEHSAFVGEIGNEGVRAEVASLLGAEGERGTSAIGGVIGEAAETVLAEPSTGQVLGHFRIIRPLGRGAMGGTRSR